MHTYIKIAVVLAAFIIVLSCNKEDEKCVAGSGGNITLVLFPKHHNKSVRPYSAWVKYNTQNAPGTTAADYDLVVSADTTEDHIHLANMKCGEYYIYMNGYDTAIKEAVKGGIPYTVPENPTGEVDIDVPVTE